MPDYYRGLLLVTTDCSQSLQDRACTAPLMDLKNHSDSNDSPSPAS